MVHVGNRVGHGMILADLKDFLAKWDISRVGNGPLCRIMRILW